MEESAHQIALRARALHRHRIRLTIDRDLQRAFRSERIGNLRGLRLFLAQRAIDRDRRGGELEIGRPATQGSAGQNPATKTAAAGEKGVRPGGHGLVHPIARLALLDTLEDDAVYDKLSPDEGIQIEAGDEHVAAQRGVIGPRDPQRAAHFVDHFAGQKSHLGFRPRVFAVVAVARQSLPRFAPRLVHARHPVVSPAFAVAPLEIVAGRNPDVVDDDFHRGDARARATARSCAVFTLNKTPASLPGRSSNEAFSSSMIRRGENSPRAAYRARIDPAGGP